MVIGKDLKDWAFLSPLASPLLPLAARLPSPPPPLLWLPVRAQQHCAPLLPLPLPSRLSHSQFLVPGSRFLVPGSPLPRRHIIAAEERLTIERRLAFGRAGAHI